MFVPQFRLLTVKVDVLTLPIRTAGPKKRSADKAGVDGDAIRRRGGGSGGGGQRASPAAFAPQALPSQQSQQTSVAHQVSCSLKPQDFANQVQGFKHEHSVALADQLCVWDELHLQILGCGGKAPGCRD